jgi:NAD(P) transhydrogenase subunit alpha
MVVGVPRETFPGENRVALIPAGVSTLTKAGLEVVVEKNAGDAAGYPDKEFTDKGAKIIEKRADVFSKADIILQLRGYGANPEEGKKDLVLMKEGQVVIATLEPLAEAMLAQELAKQKVTSFAMELIPRITRAQSMDVLSSMANIAGYKAVLLAADVLPKMFPMMMTAAGTIVAAKVFIIGAGVAGLQAIATARRLGAVVHAYDVRPAVKEQVLSLGAKFVEMKLEAGEAEDKGGYAREMDEEFYRKQRELMTRVVAENDVVITTAAIPGKKAPVLITEEMVKGMHPGSVIVDLAAERGGNCELTEANKTVEKYGVKIHGPINLAATVPFHASQMYSKNIVTFLNLLVKEGKLNLDMEDEIIRDTLVTKDGQVVNQRVKELITNA